MRPPRCFNRLCHVSSCSLATPNPLCIGGTEKGRRLVNIELWNEEYRDGIKARGDMDLCIIKPLNDVRRKFSADHYAYW